MASLGAVLEQYPNEVVIYVTDPRTGVQRGLKFPPTIAEIVAACDARMADIARENRFKNWGKSDAPMLEGPAEQRPSLDELKAKYGENWGLTTLSENSKGPKFKAPDADDLRAHYSEFGLGFARKEAV